MRRHRERDDGRGRLLHDAVGHLDMLAYRARIAPLSEGDAAIRETIERLLTSDELALVSRVVVGELTYGALGPDGGPVGPSIVEQAGVRWQGGWALVDDAPENVVELPAQPREDGQA